MHFDKAFDKVPHKRLTLNLKYYSISGPILHWLTAFLTDRTQRVLLDGSSSDTVPVSSGVPQDTVLGPLLFLLYINDLPLSTHNSSTRLFADDSLLYRAVKTPDDCRLLQHDLDSLQQWERIWQMHFRPDKCKILRSDDHTIPSTTSRHFIIHNLNQFRLTNILVFIFPLL